MTTDSPTKHNRTQARAAFCYLRVNGWASGWRADATTLAQGLPVEVRTQGLMVTLAKRMVPTAGAPCREMAGLLALWLLREDPAQLFGALTDKEESSPGALLGLLARSDRATYAAAQREALLVFDQVKIYAKALSA